MTAAADGSFLTVTKSEIFTYEDRNNDEDYYEDYTADEYELMERGDARVDEYLDVRLAGRRTDLGLLSWKVLGLPPGLLTRDRNRARAALVALARYELSDTYQPANFLLVKRFDGDVVFRFLREGYSRRRCSMTATMAYVVGRARRCSDPVGCQEIDDDDLRDDARECAAIIDRLPDIEVPIDRYLDQPLREELEHERTSPAAAI